jgi:hypothetical protein
MTIAVAAPARLWIGTVDSNVPVAAARALAERIPRCVLTELPDEGHLWVSVHHADVLAWVASAAVPSGIPAPRPAPSCRRHASGMGPKPAFARRATSRPRRLWRLRRRAPACAPSARVRGEG